MESRKGEGRISLKGRPKNFVLDVHPVENRDVPETPLVASLVIHPAGAIQPGDQFRRIMSWRDAVSKFAPER